jgi:transaldolase
MRSLQKADIGKKIKIFSDGADRTSLLEMNENPLISGMTTNPSLMKKAGVTDYAPYCKEILTQIKKKPISFEVFADDLTEIKRQALEIATWGNNVYVKIPVMNSEGLSTLELVRELSQKGIKLNITAIFTIEQSWQTCQALKGGAPSIVSIFVGRMADSGHDPLPFVHGSKAACDWAGPSVELLWASTREVYNIYQAMDTGCHIITAPSDVIKKLSGLEKTPYQLSLETIRTFKSDSESAGFKL